MDKEEKRKAQQERRRAWQRAYYHRNRERLKEYHAEYIREYMKKYLSDPVNRMRISEKRRQRYATDPEYAEKQRVYSRNYQAAKRRAKNGQ